MKQPGRGRRPSPRQSRPADTRRPGRGGKDAPPRAGRGGRDKDARAGEGGRDAATASARNGGPGTAGGPAGGFARPENDPWHFLPDTPRAAIARLGFAHPTPPQAVALPRALAGESFRALAPTGTGKTLIYLLAAWRALSGGKARVLALVPTRELAYQAAGMLRDLEPTLAEASVLAIGGHPKEAQVRRIREGWRVLIATPGRLQELLDEGSVSLSQVALAALDEFDKLVGMGFAEQVASILERVPAGAQKLLLSATGADPDPVSAAEASEPAREAAAALGFEDLPLIEAARESGTRIMEEAVYFLKSDRKKGELLLAELGRAGGQAIVFVGNREKANHLNGLLRMRGIGSRVLHGRLPQEERAAAYEAFRAGAFKVLVATDLAARGLDMPEVDLIVNYDLPKHYKDYVHRTGRAARRGRAGRCASFAGPGEYLAMRNLEREVPGSLPAQPGYAQRDAWFRAAKRVHDHGIAQAERLDRIRKEQGLDE